MKIDIKLEEIINTNLLDWKEAKVHLASAGASGINPLHLFFNDEFKGWQERQSNENFKREFIFSLIRLDEKDLWLFVGVYKKISVAEKGEGFRYTTELTDIYESLIGRLIIKRERSGRIAYRVAENFLNNASVYEIKAERMTLNKFSSYKEINLKYSELKLIFKNEYESWKSALSAVAGIYLISDTKSGKHYVGKADGKKGIWGRWAAYAENYHGGNKKLKELHKKKGKEYFEKHFRYSILETCDISVSDKDKENIEKIESRWQEKLLTRNFGYNS